jgi:hypothetical protein
MLFVARRRLPDVTSHRYDGCMLRVLAFAPLFVATLASLPSICPAQQPAPHHGPQNTAATKGEALIDALASYPFGDVYTDDISMTNSIAYAGKKVDDNNGVIPPTPVKAIGDLGKPAIPLLISHLNDQRSTQAQYRQQPVPLAYLALDLLLHLTDMNDERVIVPGCEQHGLGDCMQPDFYFSPDASDPNVLNSVQKDWAEENKRQPINFVYPSWWREEPPSTPRATASTPPPQRQQ